MRPKDSGGACSGCVFAPDEREKIKDKLGEKKMTSHIDFRRPSPLFRNLECFSFRPLIVCNPVRLLFQTILLIDYALGYVAVFSNFFDDRTWGERVVVAPLFPYSTYWVFETNACALPFFFFSIRTHTPNQLIFICVDSPARPSTRMNYFWFEVAWVFVEL